MLLYYPGQTTTSKLHQQWSGMTGKMMGSEGGLGGSGGEEEEINAAKARPVRGS